MDNLRRFIVIITLFLFLATSVCGFLLSLGYSGISKGKETEINIEADPYDPDDGVHNQSFKDNILVIIGEKNRPETDLMFILNYDSNKSRLTFLYIPKDLKYSDPVKKETNTIGGYFSNNGAEATTLLVSSLFDIGISYYINLNDNVFARMINMFEAVSFNVPVGVKYQDNYYNIDIEKGNHTLDGKMALQFIQFYKTQDNVYSSDMLNYYNGKDTSRIKMANNFISAFVEQKIGEKYKDKYFDFFKLILPDCETNITENTLKSITAKLDKVNHDMIGYYMVMGKETINVKYSIEYKDLFLDLKTGLSVDSKQVLLEIFMS